ncbi:MAG: VOC family protein [Bacteroidota bacterium]
MKADAPALFSHLVPILPVTNVAASLQYYHKRLGFDIQFKWGEPMDYAAVKRGEAVAFHLNEVSPEDQHHSFTPQTLRIFVYDVNQVHQEFLQQGVSLTRPIGNREYGIRDFEIEDPDGHRLIIGTGLEYLPEHA